MDHTTASVATLKQSQTSQRYSFTSIWTRQKWLHPVRAAWGSSCHCCHPEWASSCHYCHPAWVSSCIMLDHLHYALIMLSYTWTGGPCCILLESAMSCSQLAWPSIKVDFEYSALYTYFTVKANMFHNLANMLFQYTFKSTSIIYLLIPTQMIDYT